MFHRILNTKSRLITETAHKKYQGRVNIISYLSLRLRLPVRYTPAGVPAAAHPRWADTAYIWMQKSVYFLPAEFILQRYRFCRRKTQCRWEVCRPRSSFRGHAKRPIGEPSFSPIGLFYILIARAELMSSPVSSPSLTFPKKSSTSFWGVSFFVRRASIRSYGLSRKAVILL